MRWISSVFGVIWLCSTVSSAEVDHHDNNASFVDKSSRIIDGSNATHGRFPYFASLQYHGTPTCGGVLVAPDIVLTAAHCWQGPSVLYDIQVGVFDLLGLTESVEQFSVERYIPHPFYGIQTAFSRDFMLLVLNGTSTKPPIKLNRNMSFPQAFQSVTIIGLGSINPNFTILPNVLQQVNVNIIPNNICQTSHEGNVTYEGMITSDMMCASSPGKDSCNGDSGGPLIFIGDRPEADTLVGVVSWGADVCADALLPGVYARVSAVQDWIGANVCLWSRQPPSSFGCSFNSTFSPAPTPYSTTVSIRSVAVIVNIYVTTSASEIWWFVLNMSGEVVYIVPRFTYADDQTNIRQVLVLPIGMTYTFVIKSESGMGIYGGSYSVRLRQPSEGQGNVLVSGDGQFLFERRTNFTLVSTLTDWPTVSPSTSHTPTSSSAPTPLRQVLTVAISFAEFPEQFGYYIADDFEVTVVNETYGTFTESYTTSQKTFDLPSGRNYTFVIQYQDGYGLFPGNYSIVLGRPDQGGPVLHFSNGTFSYNESFYFLLPRSFTAVPSLSPSMAPTEAQTVTSHPTSPIQIVSVIIYFGVPASEIGFTLTDTRDNRTLFDVPFGTFQDNQVTATKYYHLYSQHTYSFTIRNNLFRGLGGNYTIRLSLPNGKGPILVYSNGLFPYEEIRTFYLPASLTWEVSSQPTVTSPSAVLPSSKPYMTPQIESSTAPHRFELPSKLPMRSPRRHNNPHLMHTSKTNKIRTKIKPSTKKASKIGKKAKKKRSHHLVKTETKNGVTSPLKRERPHPNTFSCKTEKCKKQKH